MLRRVVGESMQPTLRPGQLVIVAETPHVKVGDIVMVRHDHVEKIKRIARLDGPRVYLLGDNPAASTDSRSFGWVGMETVRGRVVWPRSGKSI